MARPSLLHERALGLGSGPTLAGARPFDLPPARWPFPGGLPPSRRPASRRRPRSRRSPSDRPSPACPRALAMLGNDGGGSSRSRHVDGVLGAPLGLRPCPLRPKADQLHHHCALLQVGVRPRQRQRAPLYVAPLPRVAALCHGWGKDRAEASPGGDPQRIAKRRRLTDRREMTQTARGVVLGAALPNLEAGRRRRPLERRRREAGRGKRRGSPPVPRRPAPGRARARMSHAAPPRSTSTTTPPRTCTSSESSETRAGSRTP
jgi:hypothetical protein